MSDARLARLRVLPALAMISDKSFGDKTSMTVKLTRRTLVSGAMAAAALPRAARADWRPTEAVRIIVPAAPGGTTDVMGRLLGQHLQVAWGQSTVGEHKSGGGGT